MDKKSPSLKRDKSPPLKETALGKYQKNYLIYFLIAVKLR